MKIIIFYQIRCLAEKGMFVNLERYKEIERSIIKKYRSKIWGRFVKAVKEFKMIEDGDKIAVCISGGKDSMLLAKCFQELKAHGQDNFEVIYLVMNPRL